MSGHSGRGGAGRRRNADEANLSHEDLVKKQKNREAARKHREKKEKNLKELEEKNKILEAQNAHYIQEHQKLIHMIREYVKRIDEHRKAGCPLPLELEEQWESLASLASDKTLHMDTASGDHADPCNSDSGSYSAVASPMSVDFSPNGTNCRHLYQSISPVSSVTTERCSTASTPDTLIPANSDGSAIPTDPAVALFSGTPLQPAEVTSPTPADQHGGQQRVSPTRRQPMTNQMQEQNQHPISTQVEQRGRGNITHTLQGHSNASEQFFQGDQVILNPTSQGHQASQVVTLNGNHSLVSNQASALRDQIKGRFQIVSTSEIGGNSQLLIQYDNVDYGLVNRQQIFTPQAFHMEETSSPQEQESQDPSFDQVSQAQSSTLAVTGNIPAAELLGNFDEQTDEIKTSIDEQNTSVSASLNSNGNSLWINKGESTGDYLTDVNVLPKEQHLMVLSDGYSYTNDLNLSENPQNILRQMQEQGFHLQYTDNTQCSGTVHQLSAPSPAATYTNVDTQDKCESATGIATTAASLSSPKTTHELNSEARETTQPVTATTCTESGVSSCVQSCAPAILDMFSEDQVTPSLHNQMKAFLTPGYGSSGSPKQTVDLTSSMETTRVGQTAASVGTLLNQRAPQSSSTVVQTHGFATVIAPPPYLSSPAGFKMASSPLTQPQVSARRVSVDQYLAAAAQRVQSLKAQRAILGNQFITVVSQPSPLGQAGTSQQDNIRPGQPE